MYQSGFLSVCPPPARVSPKTRKQHYCTVAGRPREADSVQHCRGSLLYRRAPWRQVEGGVPIRSRSPVSLPCCFHVLPSTAAVPRIAAMPRAVGAYRGRRATVACAPPQVDRGDTVSARAHGCRHRGLPSSRWPHSAPAPVTQGSFVADARGQGAPLSANVRPSIWPQCASGEPNGAAATITEAAPIPRQLPTSKGQEREACRRRSHEKKSNGQRGQHHPHTCSCRSQHQRGTPISSVMDRARSSPPLPRPSTKKKQG